MGGEIVASLRSVVEDDIEERHHLSILNNKAV